MVSYARIVIGFLIGVGAIAGIWIIFIANPHVRVTPASHYKIVCTTSMIADTVRVIAGKHAQVHSLMGPSIDPHLYRATEGDVQKLAGADLIIYNGLHLEGKMVDTLSSLSRYTHVIAVTDCIPRSLLLSVNEAQLLYDPHIWFNVSLWLYVVDTIYEAILCIDKDPAHRMEYRAHAESYKAELRMLEQYVKKKVKSLPERKRILITAHDAFRYFGDAYGFTVVGLQGISTEADIGIQDVVRLADFIITHKVPTIFVESSISPRTLTAVQHAVASRGGTVTLGKQLYSDALGAPHTPAASYVEMIRYTVDTIIEALM